MFAMAHIRAETRFRTGTGTAGSSWESREQLANVGCWPFVLSRELPRMDDGAPQQTMRLSWEGGQRVLRRELVYRLACCAVWTRGTALFGSLCLRFI